MKKNRIKQQVKEWYAKIVQTGNSCCFGSNYCGSNGAETISKTIGYTEEELKIVPEGSNLGLGCGNPVALASLKEGDIVLDLGSGAGFDAFLAAKKIGKKGRVIGVDMTLEMIKRAEENARKGSYSNVEFRLGEIEQLPVESGSIDMVISNCVINLSSDKGKVFKEAFRALKPGGRLMVSDLALAKDLPEHIKDSVEAYVGCLAGAIKKDEYLKLMSIAGFQDIRVVSESSYPVDAMFDNLKTAQDAVVSIKVSAIKR